MVLSAVHGGVSECNLNNAGARCTFFIMCSSINFVVLSAVHGGVSEWFKVHPWKGCVR